MKILEHITERNLIVSFPSLCYLIPHIFHLATIRLYRYLSRTESQTIALLLLYMLLYLSRKQAYESERETGSRYRSCKGNKPPPRLG